MIKLLKVDDIAGKEHLVKIKSIMHIVQEGALSYCSQLHYTIYLKRRYNSIIYISPDEYNRIKKVLDTDTIGVIYG